MEKVLLPECGEHLGAWQGGCEGLSSSCHDPCANAYTNCGARPALPLDQRESKRLMMKRKVLRHRPDGRVEVSEESPNMGPDTNAKPWNLGHSRTFVDGTISEEKTEACSGTLENSLHYHDDNDDCLPEDTPCPHVGDFGSNTISEYSFPERPPINYIAPQADKQKRTDRVARFNEYKRDWAKFSFPGEDAHQGVRYAMRRQMRLSGLPRRPQRHPVPNTYVVPTMKKRDSLRFGVRWDLAHRHMPRRSTSS